MNPTKINETIPLKGKKISRNRKNVEPKQLAKINKEVSSVKLYKNNNVDYEPFKLYLANMISTGRDKAITPLNPMKVFIKRVNYQDSLQVNANGHAFVALQPAALSRFAAASTASPVLYCNETSYNPNSNVNALTGGWNANFIGTAGTNILATTFSKVRVQSLHLQVQLTGVSNLNKKGTMHIAEDVHGSINWGIGTDVTGNSAIANDFALGDLPKKNHYKSIEIMNMDSDSVIKYNYIPLTNQDQTSKYNLPATLTTTGGLVVDLEKRFGLVIQGADPATFVRLIYQIDFECEVETDFYNDYPPTYSRCYIDTEPTIQYLSRHADIVLEVEKSKNTSNLNNLVRAFTGVGIGSN